MIVPMKKVAVIVQAKDADAALKGLRELGAVHVEHQQIPKGKDIVSLKDDIATLDRVIAILDSPERAGRSGATGVMHVKDWRFAAKHILDTYARVDHLEEFSRGLIARVAEWEPWGNFDPAALAALHGRGVHVKLYQLPAKGPSEIPEGVTVVRIAETKGVAYCALVSRRPFDIPFKEIVPPKMGLDEMKARVADDADTVQSLKKTIRMYAAFLTRFKEIRDAFGRELEYHEALHGMGETGPIAYLVGYAPKDAAGRLEEAAAKERWGISVTDPSEDDMVPTLVRNPRWISVISPVFKLIEIVPGYRELDISPLFLIFLSLFFGMIIGDAGYGALYIILTFVAQLKLGKKMRDHTVFHLFYLFSAAAVLWGVLTGTVFGQEWYVKAGLRPVVPILNDTKFLQAFCFCLGAIHLTLAHGWQAVRKMPSLTALADIGWISVIWAAFFLACMLILGDPLPAFTRWLIIGGVTLVIVGTSPQRNILKMVASGLGNVALSIMNNFTDVVSYVRLFAVGLAGVAIADTVNTLAAELGNPVAQVLVVCIGHTINIVLGPMSVLVHGVRLNVLEFSGHAGLTWSGIKYRPLK